jgi:hypothetical protein
MMQDEGEDAPTFFFIIKQGTYIAMSLAPEPKQTSTLEAREGSK